MNQPAPVIGKNVIETLTLGMYEDPRFIFREYIQNAADQIDVAVEQEILSNRAAGKITISIDSTARTIIVEDNATGIPSNRMRAFLSDVANSEKEVNKRKGFRGIGRLGGLGYCGKLIFESSFKGELVKNTMTLNAKLLKSIIENREDKSDAAKVISVITTFATGKSGLDEHYFKVKLVDVTNDLLLKLTEVKQYLSMVAPVSFHKDFKFKAEIETFFKSRGFALEEYDINVNKDPIFKAYKNKLITNNANKPSIVTSVDFFEVLDDAEKVLAVGWYGIFNRVNEVINDKNLERGIRLKKQNITIGDAQTIIDRFPVERTTFRYIGEIHTISDGFIPNARRDYFNDNRTVEQFEASLKKIFDKFESGLPHKASDLHNRKKNVENFKNLNAAYKEDLTTFETSEEQEQRLNEVLNALGVARNAARILDKLKEEGDDIKILGDLFTDIIGEFDYQITEDEVDELYEDVEIPPLDFDKVNDSEKRLLNEVVIFLQKELGHREAAPLIAKMQSKYN
ncbi:MAG TPA: ATP-binding protein [Mucilaginibacter sp.]|jgi:molecular chaperone HtpG